MKGLSKKIEVAANISIVLVAILLGTALIKNYVFTKKQDKPSTITIGAKLALPGIEWAKSDQTLLLVLQKGCHFCSESAPFYKQIVQEFGNRSEVQVIAALPQEVGESKQYLNELGVQIANIRKINPASLGVTGTPTVVLVDRTGTVTGVWVGRLPRESESDVINRLSAKHNG
jgi:thioredoxin-related protein